MFRTVAGDRNRKAAGRLSAEVTYLLGALAYDDMAPLSEVAVYSYSTEAWVTRMPRRSRLLCTSSFWKIRLTCVRTVATLICRASAIAGFVYPSLKRRRTSI
jgi:hypothetical protein